MKLFTSFSQLANTSAIDIYLDDLSEKVSLPFTNPYGYKPHPLALFASRLVKQQLAQKNFAHDFFGEESHSANNTLKTVLSESNPLMANSHGGRRFAVLIGYHNGQIGFTQAFSDSIAKQWDLPGFVPSLIYEPLRQQVMNYFTPQINAIYHDMLQQDSSHEALSLLLDKRREINKSFTDKINAIAYADSAYSNIICDDTVVLKRQVVAYKKKLSQQWNAQLTLLNKEISAIDARNVQIQKATTTLYFQLNQSLLSDTNILSSQSRNGNNDQTHSIFSLIAEQPYAHALAFTGQDQPLPKLLQHAHKESIKPLCFAEFWWGASPKASIYHHQSFYPVARGLCRSILNNQLEHVTIDTSNKLAKSIDSTFRFEVLFEDDDMCIINKPAGFLSVPGKQTPDSVHSHIIANYPQFSGPIIVHRLDMATSGILVLAKNKASHQFLQLQFAQRLVQKRYAAILSCPIINTKLIPKDVNTELNDKENSRQFSINLTMRTDCLDRPRQLVCEDSGKKALTTWQLQPNSLIEDKQPKVWLYPHTGRTHQLRVHCAHKNGLNAPILGDNLYGHNDYNGGIDENNGNTRLMLHADSIAIARPHSHEIIKVKCPAPF